MGRGDPRPFLFSSDAGILNMSCRIRIHTLQSVMLCIKEYRDWIIKGS